MCQSRRGGNRARLELGKMVVVNEYAQESPLTFARGVFDVRDVAPIGFLSDDKLFDTAKLGQLDIGNSIEPLVQKLDRVLGHDSVGIVFTKKIKLYIKRVFVKNNSNIHLLWELEIDDPSIKLIWRRLMES